MIRAVHDEFNALCDSSELADNKPVADKIVVVCDVLFKIIRPVRVVVVGVIAYDNIKIFYYIFYEAQAWNVRIREGAVRIGSHIFPPEWQNKKPDIKSGFSGVECGIRTHDLQCHKLTR